MKLSIILLLASIILTTAYGQTNSAGIRGVVKDAKNEPVYAATVILYQTGDSLQLKSVMTDADGKFEFELVSKGIYSLRISAAGYKTYRSIPLKIDSLHQLAALPAIILLPAKSIGLAEVVIEGKRPLIEQEIDKTVVNVSAMISSAGSNTLEVLQKTPGVTIGSNGEISLNGRSGVLVLIDGRSTYMSAADLSAYLKSIPGALLDKIELIENPSARYDAAGNAIINIRLKKNRPGGLTGSIATGLTQGRYSRINEAVSLNYNHKKLNLYGNFGYNNEKNYTENTDNRSFHDPSGILSSQILVTNNQQYKNDGFNINLGLDYTAKANTSYGFQLSRNVNSGSGDLDYWSMTHNLLEQTDFSTTGKTIGGNEKKNSGVNMNFLHKFSGPGQELSADLNYLNYRSDGTQSNPMFLYLLPAQASIYAAKADYVHPFSHQIKLETGIKSSFVNNNNRSDNYDRRGEDLIINNSQTNHFKYQENINSLYFNAQKSWKRITAQAGLRLENTHVDGNQLGNTQISGSSFTKDYTRFFPSLFLSYNLDTLKKNILVFSLTRRINRPNYQQLNPFEFFRDTYSYTAGNPLLDPQYQYRYEVRLQHNQFLRLGLSYNKFSNTLLETTETRDTFFITKPNNLKGGYMLLWYTGLSFSAAKWWNLNTEIRLSRIGLKGNTPSQDINFKTNVVRINIYNQFSFNSGWSAELGGYYASRDFSGNTITGGMYRTNAGIQKKILKNNGSIRLGMDDIFHSWVYHNRSSGLKQASFTQTNQSDTQQIGFAFTYRFGNEMFSRKRKNIENATDEEKGRL